MAYTYGGKIHDAAPEPRNPSTPGPKPKPFDPAKCGTAAGYMQHHRHGQEACAPCKAANTARSAPRCGTVAGYKRHQRRNEPTCDRCKAANATYRRDHYHATKEPAAPRPAGVFDPSACGTHNGYERHRRRNAVPCEPCRAAHTEYHRAYRTRRAA